MIFLGGWCQMDGVGGVEDEGNVLRVVMVEKGWVHFEIEDVTAWLQHVF